MSLELDNDMRRALGLAVQILEDLPDWLRLESNMRDMRRLLAGETTGRDGYIIAESIAIALCWRTVGVIQSPPVTVANSEVHINRMQEFGALFAAAKRVDDWTVAISYAAMCDRLARGDDE